MTNPGYIAVGIVGALIGSWLLPQPGIFFGPGIGASIVTATLGAIVAYRPGTGAS